MRAKKKSSLMNLDMKTENVKKSVIQEEVVDEIKLIENEGVFGLEGTYRNELDLNQLDVLVLECIRKNVERFVVILEEEMRVEKEKFKSKVKLVTPVQLKVMKDNLVDLENKLEFLYNAEKTYNENVKKYITMENNDVNTQAFLEECKKIIPISINKVITLKSLCLCPKTPKILNTNSEGVKVCPICCFELVPYDTNRTTATPKTAYDDWLNFNQAIICFQGLQSKNLTKELEDQLDKYFKLQGLPEGKIIRTWELDENGRKRGTSRNLMFRALGSIGYTNTNDIQLIMAQYWGWLLPNLGRYIEEIKSRYEQSKPYYQFYKESRKSSLGAQFRLYQILFSMDFDVDPSDFKLVMTPELQREYNDIWKKVAESLGWSWKPL